MCIIINIYFDPYIKRRSYPLLVLDAIAFQANIVVIYPNVTLQIDQNILPALVYLIRLDDHNYWPQGVYLLTFTELSKNKVDKSKCFFDTNTQFVFLKNVF